MIVRKGMIEFPIFIVSLDKHKQIKATLLSMLEKQKKAELKGTHNGFQCLSDWEIDVGEEREYFKYLYPFLDEKVRNIFDDAYKDFIYDYFFDNCWFQQYYQHSEHYWHNHGNCWGLIYYLELPDQSLTTEFYIPLAKDKIISFDIQEGDILLFPGCLMHRSPKNTSTNIRKTIIATNITLLSKLERLI